MAGPGINIPVTTDARGFDKGIKSGVIAPLDDLEDTLKDVANAGENTGEDLEDSMKDAQKATEKNEKAHKNLADQIKKTGRSGKDAGGDISDGMKTAEKGTEEFKDEANSTAREVAASFDGSAESIVGGFQEVAANALSGFGPAGAAAGIALAAGIGLATQAFEEAGTNADALKAKTQTAYEAMLESGLTYYTEMQIQENLLALTNEETTKLRKEAAEAGADEATYLRAMAGDQAALNALRVDLLGTVKETSAIIEADAGITDGKAYSAAIKQQDAANKLLGTLGEQNSAITDAVENVLAVQDALGGTTEEIKRQQEETRIRNSLLATGGTAVIKMIPDMSAVDAELRKPRVQKVNAQLQPYGRGIL
jgi:predicted  nucleic acid-binding Zn-ribbon protein